MPEKYIIMKSDGTPLDCSEPIFILRAQDMLSVKVLEAYLSEYIKLKKSISEFNYSSDTMYNEIRDLIKEFRKWPIKKIPD